MTFAVTLASAVLCGLTLLRLSALSTGSRAVDLGLAWFLGCGWIGVAAMALRFVARVPYSAPVAAAIVAGPVAAWLALQAWRRTRALEGGDAIAATPSGVAPRWLPRPAWIFAPIAVYVVVVLAAVALHGFNTPTHTSDGLRVRAFTPMLAFDDAWPPAARELLVLAGAIPTFVPALGWVLTGVVNHFDVNYTVLAHVLALVAITIGLASARGDPERGWASAFAMLSLPLFVYHGTSTTQDAVLAIFVAVGFLFAMEYGRTRRTADAARAMLLFGLATMVKREGEVVGAGVGLVFAAELALDTFRGAGLRRLRALLAGLPAALGVGAKLAAIGAVSAFPVMALVAARAAGRAPEAGAATDVLRSEAARVFAQALFESGNAGMLYWLVAAAIVLRPRAVVRGETGWPLAMCAVLLAEVAISSIWVIPEYTVDHTTVHRALIVASLPAAVWLATVALDAARAGARARPAAEDLAGGS